MAQTDTTGQLSWLLDNLVDQVEHVQQALILSRDGLVVAASRGLAPEDSEHLSALAAGLQSLARGASTSGPGRCGRPSSRWTPPSCS
jgi:predicted regulator of Ras-like GTPase activity (Roadblock/LC7/MglB family)